MCPPARTATSSAHGSETRYMRLTGHGLVLRWFEAEAGLGEEPADWVGLYWMRLSPLGTAEQLDAPTAA
jgi:hypothetical protein